MRKTEVMKRALSVLLAFCIMLSYVPTTAHAVTEDNTFTMPAGDVTVAATFADKAAEPAETNTIYFDNSVALWSTIYAYAWESETETSCLGAWPGTAMTPVDGETAIYSVAVPAGADAMIFNNGAAQTGDQILGTDNCFKAAADGSGSWYTYPCTHADGGYTDNLDGTHSGACTACGSILAESEAHTPDGNGKCTICGYQYLFSTYDSYGEDVTTEFYADLDSALAVADGVSSITVLADYTIEEAVEVTLGNSWLVLAQGVTLTNNGTLTFGSLNGFVADSGTYEGSGTVMIGESKGVIVNDTLYYHGGDVTSTGLNLKEVTNPTYYKAGDGYAIFTPSGGDTEAVLELSNASITGPVSVESSSSTSEALYYGENLTIRFSGTNTITGGEANAESNGIVVGGNLTLTGTGDGSVLNTSGGELSGTGSNCGIQCDGLIVTSGTVNARGGSGNGSTYGVSASTVEVRQEAILNAIGGTTAQGNSFGVFAQSVDVNGTLNAVGGTSEEGFSAGFSAGVDPVSITGAANGTVVQIVLDETAGTMTIAYSVVGNATLGADLIPRNPYENMDGMEGITFIVSFTVPEGTSLTIPADITLELDEADNIDIQGELIVNGTLNCTHAYDDSGKCTVCGAYQPVTVTLNGNGGEIFNGDTYDYQEMITVPYSDTLALADYATKFELAHYTLSGWNTKADGTGTSYEVDDSVTVTGDITLYAQWTEDIHTVTLLANGATFNDGTTQMTVEIGCGKTLDLSTYSEMLSKDGYYLDGWYKGDTWYPPSSKIGVTGDITLTASWAENQYTLYLDPNGGKINIHGQETTGSFATSFSLGASICDFVTRWEPEFSREGYTFKGFTTVKDDASALIDTSAEYPMPGETLTLYALWEGNPYTVTWSVEGDTYATTQVKCGEIITAPETDPTKAQEGCTAYIFTGWDGLTDGMTMPTGDLNFTAVFTAGEAHAFEGQHDDTYHWYKCSRCLQEEGKATHSWIYTVGGNTITAKCDNADTCSDVQQMITIVAPTGSRVYDGQVRTATTTGSIDGVDTPAITYTGDRKSVGTHYASIKLGDAEAKVSFEITAATPTIAWSTTTASVDYTGKAAVITAPAVTLVNGETFSGTINYSYSGTSSGDGLPTNAGTYTITASIAAQGNYTAAASTNTLTLTIEKKQLDVSHMTWTVPTDVVYSGNEYSAILSGNLPEGVEVTVSGNTGINAGSYTAKAVFSLADGYSAHNYEIVNGEDLTAEWSIAKKSVTVSAKDQIITYGETISGTEVISVGLLDGHGVTVTLKPSTANVTVNGTITPSAAVITADGADVTANYSISFSSGKLVILPDTSKIDALTTENVTSANEEDIKAVQAMMASAETAGIDEATAAQWAAITANCEALLKVIEAVQAAANTESTEKVENVTAENVKPEEKEALEDAKADLEKALADNSGNYTEEEKQAIRDEIQRIADAIVALENVEGVTEAIARLSETVEPDDEEAAEKILEAKKAYDALTEHEKSLVDETTKEKLDSLVAALTVYDIIKGDGGKWTKGSSYGLAFTANGPFSKFVGIEVDGKEVDSTYYTAESGSTMITLKQSFLKRLSTGEHTITVLYTDGETSGIFKILAQSTTPATGDDAAIVLWSAMLCVSSLGLALLLADRKRRRSTK